MDTYIRFFSRYEKKALIALSGGADSAYTLMLAVRYLGCDNVAAATCVNSHIFNYEINNAEKIAKSLGVKHIKFVAEIDSAFYLNDEQRCYYCKKSIMSEMAKIEGYPVIFFDGTNADDDMQERAGSRAIAELGIISLLKNLA